MNILLISLLNILFVIVVYIALSSKMKKMINNRPDGFDDDIAGLIREFNNVADMNIGLLDDRLKSVKSQTDKADRTVQEIEGLIKRFQLIRKEEIKQPKKKLKSSQKKKDNEKIVKKKQSGISKKVALKKNLSAYKEVSSNHKPNHVIVEREEEVSESDGFEKLVEKGLSVEEIAVKLGVSRAEIDLKLRILKFKKS